MTPVIEGSHLEEPDEEWNEVDLNEFEEGPDDDYPDDDGRLV